ncbi:MAG: potassium transporter Kup [Egibacteraceae bacterium]
MDRDGHAGHGHAGRLAPLTLGALGIVYGDIGTSPLYALRETFRGPGHMLAVSEGNVLGVLSLAFWSLIAIISVKYLVFVMRADNDGEGGVLALTSLLATPRDGRRGAQWLLVTVGLFGTALLYGDGMITPAISVLAAVEGTSVASPALQEWVVPLAVAVLIGLFAIQSRGTAAIGRLFGPVMVVWFGVLATLGVAHLAAEPSVLRAVNPVYAVRFFAGNGLPAFLSLGAVFLVVTGGEALYADMGHFGRRPIMLGWFTLALPALLLNYFGQGALLLRNPDAIVNPFYRLAPTWGVIPMVLLATAATVIASQALISGLYSLTTQAVQLDYAPRVHIEHTSPTAFGQVFIPSVNWGLLLACVGLVLGFRSSAALAAAYGVAVTATMLITTMLFAVVVRQRFGWPLPAVIALATGFGAVELGFFAANLFKILDGGWFPLVVGVIVFTVLTTWHTGRQLTRRRIQGRDVALHQFLDGLFAQPDAPARVPGTAVYLFSVPGAAPPALLTNLRHHHVLHERIVVASVATERVPRVPTAKRADVLECGHGVCSVVLRYGFMQDPNVPEGLSAHLDPALGVDTEQATYFLSAEQPKATVLPGMAQWRERLFALMHRNAASAADYFCLPPERVVIVGVPVQL